MFIVNARFLTQSITGVQRYAIEISLRLKEINPSIRFLVPKNVIHLLKRDGKLRDGSQDSLQKSFLYQYEQVTKDMINGTSELIQVRTDLSDRTQRLEVAEKELIDRTQRLEVALINLDKYQKSSFVFRGKIIF